jgi:hypothetical protein
VGDSSEFKFVRIAKPKEDVRIQYWQNCLSEGSLAELEANDSGTLGTHL